MSSPLQPRASNLYDETCLAVVPHIKEQSSKLSYTKMIQLFLCTKYLKKQHLIGSAMDNKLLVMVAL